MHDQEFKACDGSQESKKVAKKRIDKDQLLIGWAEIADHTPFSTAYLKAKHGKRLREGWVFKSHIGNAGSPMIWSYPDFIRAYVIMVAGENKGKF